MLEPPKYSLQNVYRALSVLAEESFFIQNEKKEDKAIALSPTQFKKIGSSKFIDIRTLDETVYNSIYYKKIPVVSGDMDETIIVTYSPKYKAYQQKIRSRQLDRAQKIVEGKIKKRKGKTQNTPTRFVKETNCTSDGEIAEKTIYELDQNRIAEEAKYDGFYAVITNLEDNVEEI